MNQPHAVFVRRDRNHKQKQSGKKLVISEAHEEFQTVRTPLLPLDWKEGTWEEEVHAADGLHGADGGRICIRLSLEV